MTYLSIFAAIELLLVILEALSTRLAQKLPLGGSHVAQIGILFGGGFALIELSEAINHILE